MSTPDVLTTSIGRAVVLHRLALAVECRDALSDRPTGTPIQLRWRRIDRAGNPVPPWRPIDRAARAQLVLRHRIPDDSRHPLGKLEICVDDRSRRYVPRRFVANPWTYADVREPAPYVDADARLLRLWLRPGSAYALPRTATAIRGRVVRPDEAPVRWARVEATTPTSIAGWAHADERGEFLLVVVDPGYDPIRDSPRDLDVTLVVSAPPAGGDPPDPRDRAADLPGEEIARSTNPPTDPELDNDLLRGTRHPPGYLINTSVVPPVTVPIGSTVTLTPAVVYTP